MAAGTFLLPVFFLGAAGAPTHSYMDGLIPMLDRFVADPDAACSISTVVPGRMYSCNGEFEIFHVHSTGDRYSVSVCVPVTFVSYL